MRSCSRRRALQLCGAVLTAGLAGCQTSRRTTDTTTATDPPTATAAAPATATGTPTPTETRSPTPEPTATTAWTVDRLSGAVDRLLLPAAGPTDPPAGPLYAATDAGELARIDPADGRLAWTIETRGAEPAAPELTPTGAGLYAVSETYTDDRLATHVQAIDPAGTVQWTFDDRAFLRVLGHAHDLVVLAGEYIAEHPETIGPNESPRGDGRLYGIDRATGEQRWRVDIPALHGADVATHGAYALEFQTQDFHRLTLHAFGLGGTQRWQVDTGLPEPGRPLATTDLLLAGAGTADQTDRGGVGCYDPVDGTLLWTVGNWERGPHDLAVAEDTIHAGSRPFLALDHEGNERYRVQQFSVPQVPATPETLYNDGGTQIPAVDRAAGELRWRYRPADYEYTHLRAVLADHVAVDHGIGPDQEVILLDEASGEIVGRFRTAEPYQELVGAGDRLFAGIGSHVVALDVSTPSA